MSEPTMDRWVELLCDRALGGSSDAELAELAAVTHGVEPPEGLELELAAAAVSLTALSAVEPIPAALAAKLHALASPSGQPMPAAVPSPSLVRPAASSATAPRRGAPRALVWLAMAACLAAAIAGWWPRRRPPLVVARTGIPAPHVSIAPPEPTPSDERARLLADAHDAVQLNWSATSDAAAGGASGDVVWSSSEQRGYMTIRGLAANDPSQNQYQLWIFDKARDERYPVDGGVFDVTAGADALVPIKAKLHVDDATLFAVTVERPGGVVVSKRERIVLTAKVGT